MKVFGSSGTRGVAGEQLTAEFVLRVAKAAGTVSESATSSKGLAERVGNMGHLDTEREAGNDNL